MNAGLVRKRLLRETPLRPEPPEIRCHHSAPVNRSIKTPTPLSTRPAMALHAPFSEIIPGLLYLGCARKAKKLRAAGIRFVVNVTHKRYDGRRRHLPLADGFNDPRKVLTVVACLERRLKRKQVPLYVHCRLGWSRSPVVAAVFLVKRRRFRSFKCAMRFVKRVHPPTRPTRGMLACGRAAALLLGGTK